MAVEECYEIHDNSPYLNQRWLYAAAEIFPQILTISKARKDRKKGCLRLQNHVQVENYYRLQVGDVILYQKTTILQQDGDSRATKLLRARTGSDLSIVFENSQYAVIRKPAGFHVKGRGLYSVEALARDVLTPSDRKDALPYPNAVHRLDCRVSGVLLIAKTRLADASFGRQFEKKRVQKCYRAIVVGKLEERDVIQETDRDTLLAMYPVDNPERVYVIQQNVGDRFALTYYRIVSHSRRLVRVDMLYQLIELCLVVDMIGLQRSKCIQLQDDNTSCDCIWLRHCNIRSLEMIYIMERYKARY